MNFKRRLSYSFFTKLLSIWTTFSFLVTTVASPQTQDYAQAPRGESHQGALTPAQTAKAIDHKKLFELEIPKNYGKIRDSFEGKQDKFLILIQDSHTNYEAQTNYAKVLDIIMQHVPLELIGVEGAEGDMDTILFSSIPNETVKKRVSDYLLKSGYINGAEYFGIFSEKISLYGVETGELYVKNLKTFREAHLVQEKQQEILNQVEAIFDLLQDKVFNPDTKNFLSTTEGYRELKVPFTQYAQTLDEYSKRYGIHIKPYANYNKLLKAIEIQKTVDMNQLEPERTALIEHLSKKMVKEDLKELINRGFAYRLRRISSESYYLYVRHATQKMNIDLNRFPNLAHFIQMLEIKKEINSTHLKNECRQIDRQNLD